MVQPQSRAGASESSPRRTGTCTCPAGSRGRDGQILHDLPWKQERPLCFASAQRIKTDQNMRERQSARAPERAVWRAEGKASVRDGNGSHGAGAGCTHPFEAIVTIGAALLLIRRRRNRAGSLTNGRHSCGCGTGGGSRGHGTESCSADSVSSAGRGKTGKSKHGGRGWAKAPIPARTTALGGRPLGENEGAVLLPVRRRAKMRLVGAESDWDKAGKRVEARWCGRREVY